MARGAIEIDFARQLLLKYELIIRFRLLSNALFEKSDFIL